MVTLMAALEVAGCFLAIGIAHDTGFQLLMQFVRTSYDSSLAIVRTAKSGNLLNGPIFDESVHAISPLYQAHPFNMERDLKIHQEPWNYDFICTCVAFVRNNAVLLPISSTITRCESAPHVRIVFNEREYTFSFNKNYLARIQNTAHKMLEVFIPGSSSLKQT